MDKQPSSDAQVQVYIYIGSFHEDMPVEQLKRKSNMNPSEEEPENLKNKTRIQNHLI